MRFTTPVYTDYNELLIYYFKGLAIIEESKFISQNAKHLRQLQGSLTPN